MFRLFRGNAFVYKLHGSASKICRSKFAFPQPSLKMKSKINNLTLRVKPAYLCRLFSSDFTKV